MSNVSEASPHEHVAEWVRLTDESEKLRQSDAVSNKGGRGNKGGINAAARELKIEAPSNRPDLWTNAANQFMEIGNA